MRPDVRSSSVLRYLALLAVGHSELTLYLWLLYHDQTRSDPTWLSDFSRCMALVGRTQHKQSEQAMVILQFIRSYYPLTSTHHTHIIQYTSPLLDYLHSI